MQMPHKHVGLEAAIYGSITNASPLELNMLNVHGHHTFAIEEWDLRETMAVFEIEMSHPFKKVFVKFKE